MASEVEEKIEPVAWRVRPRGDKVWHLTEAPAPNSGYEREPLYSATTLATLQAAILEKDAEIARLDAERKKAWRETRALWDALIPPHPRCRDCADCNGRCQDTGPPCDPQQHALEVIANLKANAGRAALALSSKDETNG